MNPTKKLKRYLIQLPVLGLCYFVAMVFFAIFFFNSTEGWSIFYLPFKLLSEVVGYILIIHFARGGNVNYYFTPHTPNEDEKKLDILVIKYSSKALITLTAFSFITIDIILTFSHLGQNNNFQIIKVAFFMMWALLLVTLMCEGVKYISAWWNIKRNWEKEFGR